MLNIIVTLILSINVTKYWFIFSLQNMSLSWCYLARKVFHLLINFEFTVITLFQCSMYMGKNASHVKIQWVSALSGSPTHLGSRGTRLVSAGPRFLEDGVNFFLNLFCGTFPVFTLFSICICWLSEDKHERQNRDICNTHPVSILLQVYGWNVHY